LDRRERNLRRGSAPKRPRSLDSSQFGTEVEVADPPYSVIGTSRSSAQEQPEWRRTGDAASLVSAVHQPAPLTELFGQSVCATDRVVLGLPTHGRRLAIDEGRERDTGPRI
jgi:hypothetical protein